MGRREEKSSKWEGERRHLQNDFEDVCYRLSILKMSPIAFPF
jgi:hypothetical protein